MAKEIFSFDSTDLDGMRQIMEKYGDSKTAFFGTNGEEETILISVFHDKIVVDTYQSNGWLRKNVYDYDGTCEELFEGKWTEPMEQEQEPPDPKGAYQRGFRAGYKTGFQEAKQKYQQAPRKEPIHGQTMR